MRPRHLVMLLSLAAYVVPSLAVVCIGVALGTGAVRPVAPA